MSEPDRREVGPHRELRLGKPVVAAKVGSRVGGCDAVLADVAQSVERVLGKDEVTGSIPVIGSSLHLRDARVSFGLASQHPVKVVGQVGANTNGDAANGERKI